MARIYHSILISVMESSNTKANIFFLLGKEKDQGKLRGMQMNKVTMQIITRKLTGYLVMKVELRMILCNDTEK